MVKTVITWIKHIFNRLESHFNGWHTSVIVLEIPSNDAVHAKLMQIYQPSINRSSHVAPDNFIQFK
ncbi:MAG: hypothetical protein ACTSRA_01640 [Promethearchaeota archaeon]